MAQHDKLVGLMQPMERFARAINTSNRTAASYGTQKAGSLYIPNADGTATIIGAEAGLDETGGAQGRIDFVGDTTPPSAPAGLTWTSTTGDITGSWAGTLAEGIPADFAYVELRVVVDEDTVLAGRLTEAGSTSATKLTRGTSYDCYAVAVDVQGNVSAESEHTTVECVDRIEDTVDAVDADIADVKAKADELAGELDSANQKIEQVATDVDGVKTTATNAAEKAEQSLEVATEAKQTATEIKTTADKAYEDAQSALKQSSEALQTADGLSAKVTEAAETANSAYSAATSAEQTATGLKQTVEENYLTKDAAAGEYASISRVASVEQSVEGVTTTITEIQGDVEEQSTLIRQSGNGVEVARKVDGAYTSTKTLMDEEGFHVLSADGVEMSSFESNKIELGKNNGEAEIQFCDNAARIGTRDSSYSLLGANYVGTVFESNGSINVGARGDSFVSAYKPTTGAVWDTSGTKYYDNTSNKMDLGYGATEVNYVPCDGSEPFDAEGYVRFYNWANSSMYMGIFSYFDNGDTLWLRKGVPYKITFYVRSYSQASSGSGTRASIWLYNNSQYVGNSYYDSESQDIDAGEWLKCQTTITPTATGLFMIAIGNGRVADLGGLSVLYNNTSSDFAPENSGAYVAEYNCAAGLSLNRYPNKDGSASYSSLTLAAACGPSDVAMGNSNGTKAELVLAATSTNEAYANLDGNLTVSGTGTFGNRTATMNGLAFIGIDPTGGTANDTREFWKAKGNCLCYFGAAGQLNGQPNQWGYLLNIVGNNSDEVHQEFWSQAGVSNNSRHWYRSVNASTSTMPTWTSLGLDSYPVGAVYISYVSTSPASLFGGSWTQITGRFLRMANDVNTGGTDSVSHSHWQTVGRYSGEIAYILEGYSNTSTRVVSSVWTNTVKTSSMGGNEKITAREDATFSTTVNNMPAYQDLYAWRRTA